MASCIICGSSTDGRVCDLHEEDVAFEFRGTEPDQLTPGRYYRGTVDGFADFGIFVDIGDQVTGLLHRSELDSRLESIDLDPGDTLYVQVQSVRDNGNVDLSWSIRQDESRFRGALVDDPDGEGDHLPEGREDSTGEDVVKTTVASTPAQDTEAEDDTGRDSTSVDSSDEPADPTPATVAELDGLVGEPVRLEGKLVDVRQTSGPTVFTLRDETGTVECAAFEAAGVRAYPEVDEGEIVRIEGELDRRRGELQVETEALVVLDGAERAAVTERVQEALVERARPDGVEQLADDPLVDAVTGDILDVATDIRRAVIEGRPVVVRHASTVDGYVAGAALERVILPLVRDHHESADAEYHQFERRPLEGAVYGMDDATRDVTTMLSAAQRHDEPVPLFVFVGVGSPESVDGLNLLDIYGARRVIVDGQPVDAAVADAADTVLAPAEPTTATVLAAAVAATVDPDSEDLGHLPAVSFWTDTPDVYADLATAAGYGTDDCRVLREALALVAHYQAYEDKRELVADLLFADDADVGLAEHVSRQYRERTETAVETALANLERHVVDGRTILVLDTDAYTHRFEFPSTELLLEELHRREDAAVVVGFDRDSALLRTDLDLDLPALVASAGERAPDAGLDLGSARDGRLEFLAGERDAVREALLDALGAKLPTAPDT